MAVGSAYGIRTSSGRRPGLATALVVIILVVIVSVAGVAYYLVAFRATTSSSGGTAPARSSVALSSSTSPVSSTSGPHLATTSSSGSTSGSAEITTYNGTFSFSMAVGPSGVRSLSNGTVQVYSSVQEGSGSFTFFVAALNKSGSGTGRGTLTVRTTGFCSGTTTVHYEFKIPDATTLLGNLTVFVGTPTPGNFTVPLSCTGPMEGVSTATNNPSPFLATYPNEMSVGGVPMTVTQHQEGNISYSYTITESG